VLIKKLRQHRDKNASFFFDIDVNEDGVLNRMFLCPVECHQHLSEFGDVIAMDATYKTNKFRLPLVTIVGEDNEGRTKALAYAFVTFEASDDYLWVLECLRTCLCEKEPTLFITDGDLAMINAVSQQFPSSKHFRCLWHLNENITKSMASKLGEKFSSFMIDIRRIQSEGSKEYAEEMKILVQNKYNLLHDRYMLNIFSSMDHWCEAFLPMRFCGRLRTTSPNESHHHRLKKELSATQSLCSCFETLLKMKEEEKNIPRRSRPQRFPFLFSKSMSSLLHELLDKEVMESYSVKRIREYSKEKILVEHEGRSYQVCLSNGACTCLCLHRRGYPCAHVISELLKRDLGHSIELFCSQHWKSHCVGRNVPVSRMEGISSVVRHECRQSKSVALHYDDMVKACKRLLDFTNHPNFRDAIDTAMRGISAAMTMVSAEGHQIEESSCGIRHETAVKSPAIPRRRRGAEMKRLKPGFERRHQKNSKPKTKQRKVIVKQHAHTTPSILISSSEDEDFSRSTPSNSEDDEDFAGDTIDVSHGESKSDKDDIIDESGFDHRESDAARTKRKKIPKHFGDEWLV
jgi:hypothetical protein